jgi:hypothetical protein
MKTMKTVIVLLSACSFLSFAPRVRAQGSDGASLMAGVYPDISIGIAWPVSPALDMRLTVMADNLLDIRTAEHIDRGGIAESDAVRGGLRLDILHTFTRSGAFSAYAGGGVGLTSQWSRQNVVQFNQGRQTELNAEMSNERATLGALLGLRYTFTPAIAAFGEIGLNYQYSWDTQTVDNVAVHDVGMSIGAVGIAINL